MSDVDISAALKIDGWMSEAELRWLAEQAQQHQRIVEVGSWLGRSAVALADNVAGAIPEPRVGIVYCVDVWDGTIAPGMSGGGWTRETCYAAFRENAKGRCIVPVRRRSPEAVRGFDFMSYDMIFLDADHSYEAVRADIEAWRPVLAPGGLLCGHDFSEQFDGVRRAVREMLPNYHLGPGWLWCWKESFDDGEGAV